MKHNRVTGLIAVLTFCFSTASFATPFSVNDAFLDNESPNGSEANPFGDYTFGYSLDPGTTGSFTSAGLVHTDAFNGTSNAEGYYIQNNVIVPALLINTNVASITFGFGVTLQPNQILMHPGGLGSNGLIGPFASAVIRYTVPTASTYQISAIFASLHPGETDVGVRINGASVYSALDAGTFAGTSFSLNALDMIDFVVGPGNDSSIGSDSTGLFANIVRTAVPVPGSLALLGLGLAGLGFARRKKA
jgi:hypothetical protein